jgi:hypothetical protein
LRKNKKIIMKALSFFWRYFYFIKVVV